MARAKKLDINVNNTQSLEGLMQEVYNNACFQINDAQRVINELTAGTTVEPDDVEGQTKMANAKTNALKVKDSAIKVKLDVAKLQSDIIKYSGDMNAVFNNNKDIVGKVDFDKIREMVEKNKGANKE